MNHTNLFAPFVLLMCVLGGCNSSSPSTGSGAGDNPCPPPSDVAFVNLGCSFGVPPVVNTTGPCTVVMGGGSMGGPADALILTSEDAGTCQVELTFGTGATTAFNVDFVSVSRPFGSDPTGCGYNFIAVNDAGSLCLPSACQLSIQAPCETGLDAEPSD